MNYRYWILAVIVIGSGACRAPHASQAPQTVPSEASVVGASSDVAAPLPSLYFKTAAIDPLPTPDLDMLVSQLRANAHMSIVLEGFTDERGSDGYNLELGDRRARQVKAYLMSQGIDGERILITSKGELQPVAPGHRESAWQKNRRVTVTVLP